MSTERFEVNITLHSGKLEKFSYNDTAENVDDIVSKIWYAGFLATNPENPKRKMMVPPDDIKYIKIVKIE